MSINFFNIVDLQSRQYPFNLENGIKIKTSTEKFDITLDDLKEQQIFDLINSKTVFQVVGKTASFTVNPENIVGILYTQN
jgi:hypothetical protein